MQKPSLILSAAMAVLALAACSGRDDAAAKSTRACVILPDASSSPRWESLDRPALASGLEQAGFSSDIQNAQGDTGKYATIADQQLARGCGVMLLIDHNGAGAAVAARARQQGIPVIAYDRPIPGADYYVSFDNEKVGELEGQSIVDGLIAAGKDPARAVVVYMGGDPADGNAKMFRDGAHRVMAAAGITPAHEPPGVWDSNKSATNFEQALTALGGKVDAVWAANDTNAAGVITVLDKNQLRLPVSGQDASVAGLQNVLLGKQAATVWKPAAVEARAAVETAAALLKGGKPVANQTLDDGTPYVSVEPVLVGPEQVKDVVAAGDASAASLCTADVAAACTKYGVQ
ncbi:MAG: substrate-binding domain-containing protein [Pseudomonadota bacterium]|nr:substrate-binding domain-containing protein [Pseudomonadota bacterium]